MRCFYEVHTDFDSHCIGCDAVHLFALYCKKNLAKYMMPHDFVYRKKLPKTKIGKVDFRKLQSDIGEDDE